MTTAVHIEPVAVSYDTAATMLEVGRTTIERLVADGVLPVTRIRSSPRIPVAALREFVEKDTVRAYDGGTGGADLAEGDATWAREVPPATAKAGSTNGPDHQKSGPATTTPTAPTAASQLAQRIGKKPGHS